MSSDTDTELRSPPESEDEDEPPTESQDKSEDEVRAQEELGDRLLKQPKPSLESRREEREIRKKDQGEIGGHWRGRGRKASCLTIDIVRHLF